MPLPGLAAGLAFVALTVENDFFAGYDRHYTNGIQVALLVEREDLPGFARSLPPFRWSTERDVVIAVGQRIYTPTDTEIPEPDPRDRPYGGWLYLLADVKMASPHTIDHVTASIGVVGPGSLARQTHSAAHHLFGGRSRGWHAQLRNEPTLLLGYERAWPQVVEGRWGSRRYDVSLRASATAGNVYTYAAAGVVARYGSHLPDDLPVTSISLGPPRDGYRGASGHGWYVWAGAEARAVAHNIFLDGNTWRDSASVDRKALGYDLQLGAAYFWRNARIGFTFVERGREFEGQQGPDRYGQLAISYAYE